MILVVEDEPIVRDVTRLLLERGGYTVLVAADADEALACLDRTDGEIELLLTDVVMPGMSGPELVQLLRARQPGLKVLFMSGYSRNVAHGTVLLDDDAPLLAKPFTIGDLHASIGAALAAPVA